MPRYTKKDFPVHNVRRFLEPGPIVLVSSAHKNQTNIMTMGWHMVMEFSPSLVTCLISSGNHSFEMIRQQQAMRDQHSDRRYRRDRREDRQLLRKRRRQVRRIRPDAETRHACARAPDR